MAALTNNQRLAIRALWGSLLSFRREAFPLTKPQLDAAIAATDDWIDANAAAFNNALPTAAKNNLSTPQKNELFNLVASKRFSG